MLGAIIGDIVGSVYEFNNIKTKDFSFFSEDKFFTDDTVMTVAVYSALKKCKKKYENLESCVIAEMQSFGKLYPNSSKISYGNRFANWLTSQNPQPYYSFGNGSAMRVSAVPYFAKSIDEVKVLSQKVTCVTHNHPEGIKGAECVAVCIYMALNKATKEEIKKFVEDNYYLLNFDYEDLKNNYTFNETCQNTVPQAIYCFLISTDFEDAIRTAVSIGGDTDTLCAIVGAIAEAYYGIPKQIKKEAIGYLDKYLRKFVKI